MGSEALSKVARRDIRRAYAPEASEEVLKFVDTVKADLDKRLLESGAAFRAGQDAHEAVVDRRLTRVFAFTRMTFLQRLSWLVTGTWDQ